MRRAALLLLFASALALAGLARGSSEGPAPLVPPASDITPVWSPDGSSLAYRGWDPFSGEPKSFVGVVKPGGAESVRRIAPLGSEPGSAPAVFSPDGSRISYESVRVEGYSRTYWLAIANIDGTGERVLVEDAAPLLWMRDGSILFADTYGGAVGSIHPDGTSLVHFPANVHGLPSPDGKRFAFVDARLVPGTRRKRSDVHVVDHDGTHDVDLTAGGPNAGAILTWSPDSTRIAYATSDDRLAIAGPGGDVKVFAAPAVGCRIVCAGSWSPDDRTIAYVGLARPGHPNKLSIFELFLGTGTSKRLGEGVSPSFSPDGRSIAYAAVGPCGPQYGERYGIYVMRVDGTHARRLTNDCHIVGTAGDDMLRGSLYYDIILGLGGNDTLYANDGYYAGDTLIGGTGNDLLIGGNWNDKLNGGPGDDRLYGGSGQDILVGGPGHDHIEGGPGRDTIYAADGERDWITCGTNRPARGPDRDVVYADRHDVVASDCEIVHRG